jgi:hypothetical protein
MGPCQIRCLNQSTVLSHLLQLDTKSSNLVWHHVHFVGPKLMNVPTSRSWVVLHGEIRRNGGNPNKNSHIGCFSMIPNLCSTRGPVARLWRSLRVPQSLDCKKAEPGIRNLALCTPQNGLDRMPRPRSSSSQHSRESACTLRGWYILY